MCKWMRLHTIYSEAVTGASLSDPQFSNADGTSVCVCI